MQYDNSTKGDQVSISIRDPGLPADGETREKLLHELELAVAVVLDEYGLDDESITVVGGHIYASIDANCPQCDNPLEIIEPMLDATNGGSGSASCKECGWHGDAIYRLIDLHEVQREPLDDEETDSDATEEVFFDYISSVGKYDIHPMYTPY